MSSKVRNRYHLVDESPWPFLVSTASLFLTLGAVLFFHFFVQGIIIDIEESKFSCSVISFMSLVQKAKPKILYLGGSVLSNHIIQRKYSLQPFGYGKAQWNPENYSNEARILILKFRELLDNNDKESAYDLMYAVMGNKNGFFSKSFGKVSSVINNLIVAYNKEHPKNKITEKEFLDKYAFKYENYELNFIDKTTIGTVFTNVCEILAPKIVMNYDNSVLIERSLVVLDKANLSGQKNPEYTVGLFFEKNKPVLIIYDSDFKLSDDDSFNLKLKDLSLSLEKSNVDMSMSILGMNIMVIASHGDQDSDFYFSKEQIDALISFIKILAKKYPEHYEYFDENLIEFKETGKASVLNKSNFPSIKVYRPNEFYNLSHNSKRFEDSDIYRFIVKMNDERGCLSPVKKESSVIIEMLPDAT